MSIHRHGAYSALLFCAGAALAAWARTVVPASLPPAIHADTEVSTNVPFTAWEEHQKRFEHRLSFEATPSNNVQVAFGTDADADGVLGPDDRVVSLPMQNVFSCHHPFYQNDEKGAYDACRLFQVPLFRQRLCPHFWLTYG